MPLTWNESALTLMPSLGSGPSTTPQCSCCRSAGSRMRRLGSVSSAIPSSELSTHFRVGDLCPLTDECLVLSNGSPTTRLADSKHHCFGAAPITLKARMPAHIANTGRTQPLMGDGAGGYLSHMTPTSLSYLPRAGQQQDGENREDKQCN